MLYLWYISIFMGRARTILNISSRGSFKHGIAWVVPLWPQNAGWDLTTGPRLICFRQRGIAKRRPSQFRQREFFKDSSSEGGLDLIWNPLGCPTHVKLSSWWWRATDCIMGGSGFMVVVGILASSKNIMCFSIPRPFCSTSPPSKTHRNEFPLIPRLVALFFWPGRLESGEDFSDWIFTTSFFNCGPKIMNWRNLWHLLADLIRKVFFVGYLVYLTTERDEWVLSIQSSTALESPHLLVTL